MPTTKVNDREWFATVENGGEIDLSPLGVDVGQKFEVVTGKMGGVIVLFPVD